MTKISVAMATYNGARFIREQLDSIASQTHLPAELIISDDASTDQTLEIISEFSETAPFSVIVHRNIERLGYRSNFIRCASLCSGDLIAFCDQDDIWLPQKLALQSAFFSDQNVMMVHHNAALISADGNDLGNLIWPNPKQERIAEWMSLPPWFNVPGFTQLFRREILASSFAWPSSLSAEDAGQTLVHDQWITFIANSLGSIGYIDAPLAKYRQHGGNAIGWRSERHNFLKRMRYRLENPTDLFQRSAAAASRKSTNLLDINDSLPSERRANALIASERWRELASVYIERNTMYTTGFRERFGALMRLISAGCYSKWGYWTFSKKRLIKDVILGALFGPITVKYGIKPNGGGNDPFCRRGCGSPASCQVA